MKPTPGTSLVLPLVLLGVGLLACLYGHQLATRRPQTGRRLLAADSGAAGAGSALRPGSGSSGGDSAAGGQCREAYATLLTDEAYLPGTLALVWGLQKHMRSPRAVVVLLPEAWRAERPHVGAALQALRAYVAYAPPLANPYEEGLEGASRRFETKNGSSVFMKLHFFALAAFDSVLVVDSDQLVLRSYDDIFERFDPPAFGQETYTKSQFFSSATMLIAPSFGEYVRLLAALGVLRPTADAADQGFLNAYYEDFWQHESVRNGSRHVLPWWTVAWRRVIAEEPALWAEHQDEALGLECSGPMEEKPWGLPLEERYWGPDKWERGPKQARYVEVYARWRQLYEEAVAAAASGEQYGGWGRVDPRCLGDNSRGLDLTELMAPAGEGSRGQVLAATS